MKILKRYFDEEKWEEVSPEQVREWFAGFYRDVEAALRDLFEGQTIYTDVAEYRLASR